MKYLLAFTALTLLSGCASAIDGQTQNVTLRTPGAENARCYLENEDMKYVVETDETINIMKSPNDLEVRCLAAGNREKTIIVQREVNDWVAGNVATGVVPGAAYDYFSRGGFEYPEEIIVDFSEIPVTAYPLPKYHSDDLGHNNYYNRVERIGPTEMVTEQNRYNQTEQLHKKQGPYDEAEEAKDEAKGESFDAMLNKIHGAKPAYNPSEEDK